MSDLNSHIESADTAPVQGQVESTDIGASEDATNYFNIDEYADQKVRVKLDGEEFGVPLSEAVAGYQRQADYTRKTQELATQRESMQFATAIQEALQQDPSGTIELLQRHYGVNLDSAQQVEEPEFADPLERQLWEVNQRVAEIESFRSEQQLQAEISSLQSRYQDFDPQAVVLQALKMGSSDLEATYKQMAFDRMYLKQQAEMTANSQAQAQESQVMQAKRDAGIVSGGSGNAASAGDSVGPVSSIRDAWEAAKREHGNF